MQYRVNVPLLVGLVVGTIVLIGGSYGLYRFQKSRNADRLLTAAAEAKAAGDLEQSRGELFKYLQLRPNDEDAMVEMSNVSLDIAEQPRAEVNDVRRAIGQTEATLREFSENTDLRRRLLDFYMDNRILNEALDHVELLLSRNPGDPELEVMRSTCLFGAASPKAVDHAFKLIGYVPETDGFDAEEAIAPGEPTVYIRVAMAQRRDELDEKLADRIVEQMIEANPEKGEAYLARGQYFQATDREEQAKDDFRRALELAPDDPAIVIANSRLLTDEEQYDQAREMLNEAIEKNQENSGLYLALADVEIRADKFEEAMAICDRGLAAVPATDKQVLMFQKARLQLQFDTPEATRKTIDQMRQQALMQAAYPDYLEARLMMEEGKWFKAAQVFEKYQSFMSRNAAFGSELNMMLGLCRERLGQLELAAEAFDESVRLNPENKMAELSRLRVLSLKGGDDGGRRADALSIYDALAVELAKPEGKQNWKAFDELAVQYIERSGQDKAMLDVLRGEIFMKRKMYPEARAALMGAFKKAPDNLGVRRAAVKLFAADPEQGPVKALRLLDEVVKKFGDMPILRLERADLLSVINDEDLTNQLFALTEGIDDWSSEQKVQLWRGLSDKFARLGNQEARAECLQQVAELAPSDLAALLELFAVARSEVSQTAMRDAQQKILDVVGSKEDPTYQFTEANRLLIEWQTSGRDPETLKKAESLVDRAISSRREWSELHTLKGRIAMVKGDIPAALASYDRAVTFGRQDALAKLQYVELLMRQERYADALAQMDDLAEAGRTRLLGKDYAECLRRLDRVGEAIVAAESYGATAPNDAGAQLWLGRFLSMASVDQSLTKDRREEVIAQAGEAFQKSVELNPAGADSWLALVEYYVASGQRLKAEDAIRQAQLVLPEDQNPLVYAHCYQVVGRVMDAQALFEQAMDNSEGPARSNAARMAARFYLGPVYRANHTQEDALSKATPLVNQVLRDVADKTIERDSAVARWARTEAARMLAQRGTYQELRNAERLLSSNVTDGALASADRLLLAEILAPRPEPVSRQKAVKLFEELGENQRLSMKSDLDLAKLYFALDRWRDCRDQMLKIIARYPENPEVRLVYIEMLLNRGESTDIDQAVSQVKRLREIAGNNPRTVDMLARVAHKKGRTDQAVAALLQLLPRDASQITADQLPILRLVGGRLIEFEAYDRARKVFELAARVGDIGEKLALAQFVGEHVDAGEGIEQLVALRGEAPIEAIAQRGLAVLREVGGKEDVENRDELFDKISDVIDRGLREDPDMISLKLQEAELLDLRRKYGEAVVIYKSLLDRPDLTGFNRAVVLNNLAYLLALDNADSEALDQAGKYIGEAVAFLGPSTDILDTRAVVAIADKRYKDAISDLRLAVIDRPTASKYFHLATAYLGAGNPQEAKLAWEEAVERGLDRESVSVLERAQFDKIERELSAGGLTNVAR